MNIVIIGAGNLGVSLAEYLTRLHHHVAIIERNSGLLANISSRLDVLTISGTGASPSALEEAGIERADMIIAVTPNDETNLLACSFAKQYGVQKRIARILSDEYTNKTSKIDLEEIGATHVIEAEKELVKNLLQHIELPGLLDTADFHGDKVALRGYRITPDMPIAGKSLWALRDLAGAEPMLVVAIIRNGHSIIPSGSEQLLPGDETITILPKDSFASYRMLINRPATKLKKVIVSGDSLAALHIAGSLKQHAERVIFIDPDPEHGRLAASQLNHVDVLQGDCTNGDILQEVKVQFADFFIAANKDMEDNIMSTLLAKAEGAKEVIAIRNDDRHLDLFHTLGIDHVINSRSITLQKIIESIQALPIGPLLKLKKVGLDVVRIIAGKHSPIVNKPLAQLDKVFRKELIIGAVIHEGNITIPRGDTVIQENDEVIVLFQRKSLQLVNNIFKTGLRL